MDVPIDETPVPESFVEFIFFVIRLQERANATGGKLELDAAKRFVEDSSIKEWMTDSNLARLDVRRHTMQQWIGVPETWEEDRHKVDDHYLLALVEPWMEEGWVAHLDGFRDPTNMRDDPYGWGQYECLITFHCYVVIGSPADIECLRNPITPD